MQSPLKAQTVYYWLGNNSNWFDASNWANNPNGSGNHNVPPDGGINVTIDTDAVHMPELNYAGTTINVGALKVGSSASSGSNTGLTIFSGTSFSSNPATIGFNTGSTGKVAVYGNWTTYGDFYVGQSGTGILSIYDGGTVSSGRSFIGASNGSGFVTVIGPDSTWDQTNSMAVGYGSNGLAKLQIVLGGHVSNTSGIIGGQGAIGTVIVDGAGSKWEQSLGLEVGNGQGNGEMIVSDGGHASVGTDVRIGVGSIGVLTVTGPGSTLVAGRDFSIGNGGGGSLVVSNGGSVTVNPNGSYFTSIGAAVNSNASVSIDGSGSTWTNTGRNLEIGNDFSSRSLMEIRNGGLVTNAIGRIRSGSVVVTGTGSTWTNAGNLYVGYGSSGSLTIGQGGVVNVNAGAGTVYLGDSSTAGYGTLNLGSASNAFATSAGALNAAAVNVPAGRGSGVIQFNTTGTAIAPTYFSRDGTAAGTGLATSGNLSIFNSSGYTVFTGALGHTGGTIIFGGTVQIGAGGTTGSIAGDIYNHGTLVFNRIDALTYSGVISGTGGVTQSGTGALTLSGANTYTGATIIQAGSLKLGADNVVSGVSPVAIASSATFDLNGFSQTIGRLSGDGSLALGSGHLTLSTDGTSAIFSGVIAGAGSLTKTNLGLQTFSGTSTYTGATNLNAGKLRVNGSIAGSSLTTVAIAARAEGTGTIGNFVVQAGGIVTPGFSGLDAAPGRLTVGDTKLFGGSLFQWNITDAGGLAGTGWGQLVINGTLSFDDSVAGEPITLSAFSLANGALGDAANFDPAGNYRFNLITAAGGILDGSADYFAFDPSFFTNAYDGTWSVALDAHHVSLIYTAATPVPEPATSALLTGSCLLAGLLVCRWRRRTACSHGMSTGSV